MDVEGQRELLLLKLIHLIANQFKNTAVLKGGMCLRLLNSPRHTQDVDYVFVNRPSRRAILAKIKEAVSGREDMRIVASQLNSRGLVVEFDAGGVGALLEIAVVQETGAPPESMTTTALAAPFQIPAQVITVMALTESYSHKIAACLERKVMRDLYDLTILQPLTPFDKGVLVKRLERISIARKKPVSLSFTQAAVDLKKRGKGLVAEDLEELRGMVPEDFFSGGIMIIKNCLNRLARELSPLEA